MKTIVPEFSRPLLVARIPGGGAYEKLEASPTECSALAKRLDIPALHGLKAELKAKPWRGGGLKVSGELNADLDQVSVVSLEIFRSVVTVAVERYFLVTVPADADDAEDVDPIVNGIVDLGEVVAESLALELDPYPRKVGENFASGDEVDETVQRGAFAGLKVIKSRD